MAKLLVPLLLVGAVSAPELPLPAWMQGGIALACVGLLAYLLPRILARNARATSGTSTN